jgi:K+-sensing histidine kinase KdpD
MKPGRKDRILIVEADPIISDLIGRQALASAGYQTYVVADASEAITKVLEVAPDVIIADLLLPGLSGKDMLVALKAQGVDTPVILVAQKGLEADVIQAFRLGAVDYLFYPFKEPEVLQVVERVLTQAHDRQERNRLSQQLNQTNQELQLRVRELTTIFSIGKAVTSITNQSLLFEKIVEGAVSVTQADLGWFLLRDEKEKNFVLVASQKLPPTLMDQINRPWDDGISSLVAMSGEPLSIHGDMLKRFKIYSLGQSALIVPVRAQKQVISLLVVMRKQAVGFSPSEQHLLEAVADYAAISLVNVRLFRALEERAAYMQSTAMNARVGEKINEQILQAAQTELRPLVGNSRSALERLSKDPTLHWSADQRHLLTTLAENLGSIAKVTEAITPQSPSQASAVTANLVEVARKSASHFQHVAMENHLSFTMDLPGEVMEVQVGSILLSEVLDGLLSNAVKYCKTGGRIHLRVEKTRDNLAHVEVHDGGTGLDAQAIEKIMAGTFNSEDIPPQRFGGLGISLPLVKEIITNFRGKFWIESKPGQGALLHFTLPVNK